MLLSDHFRSNSHLTPWPCADHHPVQKTNAFAPHPLCFAEGWVRNLVQVQSSPFTKDWSLFRIIMIPKMSLNVTFFFFHKWVKLRCVHVDTGYLWFYDMQYAGCFIHSSPKTHVLHKQTPLPAQDGSKTMENHDEFAEVCLKTWFCTWKKPYTKTSAKTCWDFYSKPCETNQLWGHLIARHTHILSIGMV